MGHLFRPKDRRIDAHPASGCWIEVVRAEKRLLASLFRLELDLASPLTPRSNGGEKLPRGGEDFLLELRAGVWWCDVVGASETLYLLVEDGRLKVASKAEAYCALGAVDRLNALGLEDAAIALAGGDFDHASVQVIAHRQQNAD